MQLLFHAYDRNRRVDTTTFSIVQCQKCLVGATRPQLAGAALNRYYPQEYYSLDTNLALEAATRKHNEIRLKRIQRFAPAGRLLDIGAGTGMFLKTAKEYGFDAEGLEMAESAAAFGRTTWGLRIHHGNLRETSFPVEAFDVVTLGHVFEHLDDPRAALTQLASLLTRGGLLVIAVPNFSSVQARLFRARWFHLDVPRHLFHYSPASLTTLVKQAGFDVVDLHCFSAEHNWAGILGSVMQLSRPGESALHKLIRKFLGVPLSQALAFAEAALGRGGTFELYAIKQ